jgi:hypothetical protein
MESNGLDNRSDFNVSLYFIGSSFLPSKVTCNVRFTGLNNPAYFVSPSSPLVNAKIISSDDSLLSYSPIKIFNGVSGGRVYDDSIRFSNKALAKLSNLTYTFTYDKDLCIGSQIRLNLPSWTGTASSVSIANGCGSSNFTLQDVPGYCEDKRFSSEADCSIRGVWVEEDAYCTQNSTQRSINASLCTAPSKMWSKVLILTTRARPLVRDTACTLPQHLQQAKCLICHNVP